MKNLLKTKYIFQSFDNYVKSKIEKAERRNILIQINNKYSLLKYESHDFEVLDSCHHRMNRNVYVFTSSLLLARTKEERDKIKKRQNREWKRYQGNIYGTHRLSFKIDEELGIFLPSSSGRDIFITLATENIDGDITSLRPVEIIADIHLISARLREITRPKYFNSVIVPFLDSMPTAYQIPRLKNKWFFKTNRRELLERYEKSVKELDHGAFVYIGCKEEVYLLALAKDDDGRPYMQGTYTTSVKPLLYFSNNYLGSISRFNIKGHNIPDFDGLPFVFPQIGRSQDCKNTIFTGEPDIITGDIDEALVHFRTTDFSEFSDIVKKYSKMVKIIGNFRKPNGKYGKYYY